MIARLPSKASARGALLAVVALLVAATVTVTARPAMADGTRLVNGVATCANFSQPQIISSVIYVNHGAGWVMAAANPGTPGGSSWSWSATIPAGATSLAVDAFCYLSVSEYYGYEWYPRGYWIGYAASLSPGTSTVTGSWSCTRRTEYPGVMIRRCDRVSLSAAVLR